MAGIKNNRRTIYTKKAINDAFIELLNEKDLAKITVTEICTRANINRGTFYQYYDNPESLYDALEQELKGTLLPMLSEDVVADFEGWMKKLIVILQDNRTIAVLLLKNLSQDNFVNSIFAAVQPLVIEKFNQIFDTNDANLVNFYFSYFVNGAVGVILQWLHDPADTSIDQISHLLAKLLEQPLKIGK